MNKDTLVLFISINCFLFNTVFIFFIPNIIPGSYAWMVMGLSLVVPIIFLVNNLLEARKDSYKYYAINILLTISIMVWVSLLIIARIS